MVENGYLKNYYSYYIKIIIMVNLKMVTAKKVKNYKKYFC